MDTYEHLLLELRPDGVLLITINRPERMNAANPTLHRELGSVWRDVSDDPDVRVAVITGAGRAFCAGGDIDTERTALGDFERIAATMRDASAIVYNIIDCEKPVISAINGVAVGAGMAVALMADISLIGDRVRLTDGHLRIGIVAGDHSAMIWPLLCGMARAKYYLLTSDFIDGPEAERIGLVSKCVPQDQLLAEALAVAQRLAAGPQLATRWTKRSLNNWLRHAGPIFDASLALEMLTLFGPDAVQGMAAVLEHRPPEFTAAPAPR